MLLVLIRLIRRILCIIVVGNPNPKKMHIFGFVGIFEYIC